MHIVPNEIYCFFFIHVRPLGLEPRTTEVYECKNFVSARLDSNQGPQRYKLCALPTELQADTKFFEGHSYNFSFRNLNV